MEEKIVFIRKTVYLRKKCLKFGTWVFSLRHEKWVIFLRSNKLAILNVDTPILKNKYLK